MRWRMVILSGQMRTSLDEQAQYALAFVDAGDICLGVELGEDAVEVGGEFEVGLAVCELGVECLDLVALVGFSCVRGACVSSIRRW